MSEPLVDGATGRVPVRAIEAEIRRLWRENAKEGSEPVTRACLLTLVALVADETELANVTRAARAAAARHPARLLFVLARLGDSLSPSIDAAVNAYCTVAGRGRRQVCHEDVEIAASGAAVESVPSAVRPLLVPDLPVLLWMPSDRLASTSAASALVQLADRVIVDSAAWEPASIRRLLADGAAVSDLAFGRTLPWRRAIAALFDGRECAVASEIGSARVAGAPPDAAILAAWIEGRSGVRASVERTSGAGIRSVSLEAGPARFRVELSNGSLAARIDAPGACRPWSEPFAAPSEDAIVEAEIARAAADPVATATLEAALTALADAR